jgi:hypothetical protein
VTRDIEKLESSYSAFRIDNTEMGHGTFSGYREYDWSDYVRIPTRVDITPHLPAIQKLLRKHCG